MYTLTIQAPAVNSIEILYVNGNNNDYRSDGGRANMRWKWGKSFEELSTL
jgi:hypothetical protein